MTCACCSSTISPGDVSYSLLSFFQSRGVKPQQRTAAAAVRVCKKCFAKLQSGGLQPPMKLFKALWAAIVEKNAHAPNITR